MNIRQELYSMSLQVSNKVKTKKDPYEIQRIFKERTANGKKNYFRLFNEDNLLYVLGPIGF